MTALNKQALREAKDKATHLIEAYQQSAIESK